MDEKWFDVEDEEGIWRVGFCLSEDAQGTKNIALDGFHPNYHTFYCKHTHKILPIRTKTVGLTVPQNYKPLRQVITNAQIQNVSGKLNLFLNYPNLLQLQPKLVRTSIRTQFLIVVDKIMCSPFQIIRDTKLMQLHISKLFINLLALYLKVIQYSKVYIPLLQSNAAAVEIYKAVYELTNIADLILGNHLHSPMLYDHKFNINLKSIGFVDYFIQSQFLLPFRNFFKKINTKKLSAADFEITKNLITLFLNICEKGKKTIAEGQNQAKASLVIEEIINHIKNMIEGNGQMLQIIQMDITLIGKVQNIYNLLKPNKTCPFRGYLLKKSEQRKGKKRSERQSKIQIFEKQLGKEKQNQKQKIKKEDKEESDGKILQLEERLKKLQTLLVEKEKKEHHIDKDQIEAFSKKPNIPTQNLGEEMFLASLEWALQTGQLQTAKKLTKWRRSLIQIGRITGWEVALTIGCKTFKKAQITPADIIEANYEYIAKQN